MFVSSIRWRGLCVFFFSSRRRHTRCSRDWSSDVCSSDLGQDVLENGSPRAHGLTSGWLNRALARSPGQARREAGVALGQNVPPVMRGQIGRASGRERGEISGGAVSLKKKKKKITETHRT